MAHVARAHTVHLEPAGRRMSSSVTLLVRLSCFIEEEGNYWIAGCPRLDVYSQGDSKEDAKESIEEAIKLWFESCLERNTLALAMQELGFKLIPSTQVPAKGDDAIAMVEESGIERHGDPFEVDVEIPAYQAAMFSESVQRLDA